MKIYVKTLTGETITIEVEQSESIDLLKEKIYEMTQTPLNEQRLIWAGKILENETTLADYGVIEESTLHMVLRVRGGGFVGDEAVVKGYLRGFGNRLKEYKGDIEEEKLDVGYYLAQSGHNIGLNYEAYYVKFWIDEKLDEDWIKIFKDSLKTIMKFAPGLNLRGDTFSEEK